MQERARKNPKIAWALNNEVAEIVNEVAGNEAGIAYLPMRLGEHRSDDVIAKGEGWELLDWRPRLDREALAETVRVYSDAAWYD